VGYEFILTNNTLKLFRIKIIYF